MAEPTDLIFPILREIRAEIASVRDDVSTFRKEVNDRFDVSDRNQKSFKHAMTADTLMSKLLTGEFDERIEALERKVSELMAGQT